MKNSITGLPEFICPWPTKTTQPVSFNFDVSTVSFILKKKLVESTILVVITINFLKILGKKMYAFSFLLKIPTSFRINRFSSQLK